MKKKNKEKFNKFPYFIDEFFTEIKVKTKQKQNLETLVKYLDKDFFIEEINYNLESSIDNYFDLG